DVLHGEPWIERVQHGATERDPEIGLQVAAVVPGERGDPIAGLHAQTAERVGELLRAAVELAVGAALDRTVRPAPDDLGLAEVPARPVEEVQERERDLHHQSIHWAPPAGLWNVHP